jgi:hypothetical protein
MRINELTRRKDTIFLPAFKKRYEGCLKRACGGARKSPLPVDSQRVAETFKNSQKIIDE